MLQFLSNAFRKRPAARYSLVLGDICRQDADAVVNAADNSLLGGTGVDGALRTAAGPRLSLACRALGGLQGKPKATPGFDLPARHVIHAAAPVYLMDMEVSDLAATYRDCVELAGDMELSSIAFPLLGAGVFGWDAADSALAAQTGIAKGLRMAPSVTDVILVAFSRRDAEALSGVFGLGYVEEAGPRIYNTGTI